MEYDEGREITRLIAEEMLSVGTSFPQISPKRIRLLAALHLTKGLTLQRQYQDIFEDACSAVIETTLKDFDDTEIRSAFNDKLTQMKELRSSSMDREVRVKTATYLIDLFIMDSCNIPYGHPTAVAALVGSIHSTLHSHVIEVAPTTAELSMGKERIDDSSFPMIHPTSRALRYLISLKLIINKIYPYFIDGHIQDVNFDDKPSFLLDSHEQFSLSAATGLSNFGEFTLNHNNAARFILVIPASNAKLGNLVKGLSPALKTRLRLDAAICFSVSETRGANNDKVLLIFSQGINLMRNPHIYIDVSMSNKSLEHLDLQERAILAGHIVNIHEARDLFEMWKRIPTKVATILNAQFSDGYHNVKILCIENEVDLGKPLKIHSPKNFIRNNRLEGNTFNITADPQAMVVAGAECNTVIELKLEHHAA
ncbi:hypothetical protein [Pseudomonas lactis]|uniref:hypothetical protein n=1 Tax=Pseudomonas lactis TaxID=1615674 RepID=UPI00110C8076|nr:hypothetical protein [Pseudomonas lactis]